MFIIITADIYALASLTLLSIFFSTEKEALDTILSHYSVINKVINSSRKLPSTKISKFESYCKEAYIFRLKSFTYWPKNMSIHRLWGHSAQKMEKLGGFSLGLVSENSLERMVCIIH